MADHRAALRKDGFSLLTRRRVALAHFVWYVEMEVEQVRALRLVEETILQLVAAGVDDPDSLAELMGLDECNIVPEVIADLLRKNALRHDEGVLLVSAGGAAVLSAMALRETTRSEERLFHDPYRDRIALVSSEREHLSDSERRAAGLPGLPVPPELTRTELQNRHLEIQASLDERDKRRSGASASQVELLRVLPRGAPHFVWEEADIEVWHDPIDDARWDWRVLVDDIEDDLVRARLLELEDDGADIVSLDEAPRGVDSSWLDALLSELFESSSPITDQLDMREAAMNGGRAIVFIGPSGAMGATDVHVLHGIAELLDTGVECIRIATTMPVARKPAMADPVLAIVEHMAAEEPKRVIARDAPSPLAHGLLAVDGERVYVTRYRFAPYSLRPGRGIWWTETRSVSLEVFGDVAPRINALF